ncbi:MAG: hypothetical protein Q7S48_04505 [bacterium]|nr:hypothetical protein [bacterium]
MSLPLNQGRIHDLADGMARKLEDGVKYDDTVRVIFQGLHGDERTAYIKAVASKLSSRRHLSEAKNLPDAPVREAIPTKKPPAESPRAEQLEFPGAAFQKEQERPSGYPVRRRAA